MKNNEITIIGAGNGGRAFAAYLSNIGFNVNLGFNTYENIRTIHKTKKIYSKGMIHGEFPLIKSLQTISKLFKIQNIF